MSLEVTIEESENGDTCEVTFEYASAEGAVFSFGISDVASLRALTVADWMSVLTGGELLFGEVYGSHVDNGIIAIKGENGKIRFLIDGARGGVATFTIPVEHGVHAFEYLAQTWGEIQSKD